jgi:hypothetical protein
VRELLCVGACVIRVAEIILFSNGDIRFELLARLWAVNPSFEMVMVGRHWETHSLLRHGRLFTLGQRSAMKQYYFPLNIDIKVRLGTEVIIMIRGRMRSFTKCGRRVDSVKRFIQKEVQMGHLGAKRD